MMFGRPNISGTFTVCTRDGEGLNEALDGMDDERGRDLVELSRTDRPDEIALEAPTLILIAHDAPALQAAPKLEGVSKRITQGRFLTDLLFLSSRELSGLRESQGGKVTEKVISHLAVLGNSEDETFGACWLNFY